MSRYALPGLVFVALVAVLGYGLTRDPRTVPSPLVGKALPAFDLPELLDPERRVTSADLRGRVTLLNVWASWCVSCRDEHAQLLAIARSGVVPIYGLNWKDDRANALAWITELGNPYVASAVDQDGRIAIDYGVYGAPETYVIDANGVIVHKRIGPITPEIWESELLPRVRAAAGGPG